VRSTELAVAAATTFAALLASYSAFRPVRDALIFDRDVDKLPWVFTGTLIAISLVSPLWSALLARRPPRRYVSLVFHAFAATAVVFFVVLRSGIAPVAVGRVFYVWSAVFNLFVVSVFWSLLADLLGQFTARKLYGWIAAGGTLGALLGPLLTDVLVAWIRPAGVLLMSAALLELAVLGVAWVRRAAAALPPPSAGDVDARPADSPPALTDAPLRGSGVFSDAFAGILSVLRTPYLGSIVGYVLCTSCAATFMYLAQARIVHDAHLETIARTRYLASIDWWTQGVVLVLQAGIAGPAIRRLGPGIVLCVLPIAYAVGLTVVAGTPTLGSLAAMLVITKAATHGLTRPSRELLFTVVSRDDKYRAKNAIDTLGYRLGDFVSGWLNTGLAAIGGAAVAIATFPLVALWLGLAASLAAGFRRRTAAKAAAPDAAPALAVTKEPR
jgi:AAA family ATP:ADP antiporter